MNRATNLTCMVLVAVLISGASCSKTKSDEAGTPTAAYKAAHAARKNRDVSALKKLMSKDILEFFTKISGLGEKNQSVDQLLMELCEKPQAATAEARNEKINGDTANIEYIDENGGWQLMEFVKEDGAWKLTIEMPEKGDLQLVSSKWKTGGFGAVAIWEVTIKNVSDKPLGDIKFSTEYYSETQNIVSKGGTKGALGKNTIEKIIPPKSSRTFEVNDGFVSDEAHTANFKIESWRIINN